MLNDVRPGDLIKVIWWDGQGACLFSKRLERGRFVWPSPAHGKLSVTSAQLAMLLEGIDWRIAHSGHIRPVIPI
jgi:transposase